MKKRVALLLICIMFITSLPAKEPKVALVLGGGGARGLSEIAVIEELERRGIPVDMVLGTSMGALIGAIYSCGYSPQDMRLMLEQNNLMDIVLEIGSTRPFPPPVPFENRGDNIFSISFGSEEVGAVPGILGDFELLDFLNGVYSVQAGVDDFDRLPIPFRCVATDAVTGDRIVYDSGSLITAVRSSISLPVIFPPYPQEDGTLAMDGGMVDNIPIRLARDLGADIVIAVNVDAGQLAEKEDLQSLSRSFMQWVSLATQPAAIAQFPLADLVIEPDLSQIDIMAYHEFEKIVECGEKEVARYSDQLDRIAEEIEAAGRALEVKDPSRVGEVTRVPECIVSSVVVRNMLTGELLDEPDAGDFSFMTGKVFDGKQRAKLGRELGKMKARYGFDSLSYDVRNRDDGTLTLLINCTSYDSKRHRFTIGAYPEFGISNNGHSQLGWTSLQISESFCFKFDSAAREVLLNLHQGNRTGFTSEVILPVLEHDTLDVSAYFGGGMLLGGFCLDTFHGWGDHYPEHDHYQEFEGGFMLRTGGTFQARAGAVFNFLYADRQGRYLLYPELKCGLSYDSRTGESFMQSGLRFDMSYRSQWRSFSGHGFGIRGLLRQDFCREEKWMLGYEGSFACMRLDNRLVSSYCDIGGLNGLPGYSLGTLRNDFVQLSLRGRMKIARFFGLEVDGVSRFSVALFSDEDPLLGEFSSDVWFSGRNGWDAGLFLGVAVATPFGNFISGMGKALHSRNFSCIVGVSL